MDLESLFSGPPEGYSGDEIFFTSILDHRNAFSDSVARFVVDRDSAKKRLEFLIERLCEATGAFHFDDNDSAIEPIAVIGIECPREFGTEIPVMMRFYFVKERLKADYIRSSVSPRVVGGSDVSFINLDTEALEKFVVRHWQGYMDELKKNWGVPTR